MSDVRQYAVWLDPWSRSRSRALHSWKSFYFQTLSSPPFTMGAGNWPLILKLGHNIWSWSGRIFDICPSFCVTWLWTSQKHQLRRVDRHSRSRMGLIYFFYKFSSMSFPKCLPTSVLMPFPGETGLFIFPPLSSFTCSGRDPLETSMSVWSSLFSGEMHAGHIACWSLVSHGEYVDGTDGQTDGRTPDNYTTLCTRRGQIVSGTRARCLSCQSNNRVKSKHWTKLKELTPASRLDSFFPVSYTHLTLPTIYSV